MSLAKNNYCIACKGSVNKVLDSNGGDIFWCINVNAWGWRCLECNTLFHSNDPVPYSGMNTFCPNCNSTSLAQDGAYWDQSNK